LNPLVIYWILAIFPMAESKRLVVATSTCFLTAFVIIIVSLATPAWINEDFHGLSVRV
jgi:hypothetical protein